MFLEKCDINYLTFEGDTESINKRLGDGNILGMEILGMEILARNKVQN